MIPYGNIRDAWPRAEDIEAARSTGHLLALDLDLSAPDNADHWRPVLEQARALGVRSVALCGEHLLERPASADLLHAIHDMGATPALYLDDDSLTHDQIEMLAALRAELAIPVEHNVTRAALLDAGYGRDGIALAVTDTWDASKASRWPEDWHAARQAGVTPLFRLPEDRLLTADETLAARDIFAALAERDEALGYPAWIPLPPLAGPAAQRHRYACRIDQRGEVYPSGGLGLSIGNITEQPLAKIIADSEVLPEVRAPAAAIKGPCRACPHLPDCGGSRAAAWRITGDYMASDPNCWLNLPHRDSIEHLPMAADTLMPHAPPMRFIDRLLEVGERRAVAACRIRPDTLFMDPGGCLDRSVFLELLAQAAAAHNGFRERHQPNQPGGLLLGARQLEIFDDARPGDELTISIRKIAKLGDFGILEGDVHRAGACIARGEIKAYYLEHGAPHAT